MALLDLCEKYFGCRSFYEVLSISKDASEKEGRFAKTFVDSFKN